MSGANDGKDENSSKVVVRRIQWLPSIDDLKDPFHRVPCYRDALMYGLAGGIVCGLGLAWLRNHPRYMVDGFFLGTMATSTISFLMCTRNSNIRKQSLKKAFALQSKPTDVSTKLKEGTKAAEEAERFANEGATGVHDKS